MTENQDVNEMLQSQLNEICNSFVSTHSDVTYGSLKQIVSEGTYEEFRGLCNIITAYDLDNNILDLNEATANLLKVACDTKIIKLLEYRKLIYSALLDVHHIEPEHQLYKLFTKAPIEPLKEYSIYLTAVEIGSYVHREIPDAITLIQACSCFHTLRKAELFPANFHLNSTPEYVVEKNIYNNTCSWNSFMKHIWNHSWTQALSVIHRYDSLQGGFE